MDNTNQLPQNPKYKLGPISGKSVKIFIRVLIGLAIILQLRNVFMDYSGTVSQHSESSTISLLLLGISLGLMGVSYMENGNRKIGVTILVLIGIGFCIMMVGYLV
jgi:hypothetical protein